MDGQSKTQQEINKKVMELKQHVDGGYIDLQTKFKTLNSQFKSLDNRIAQVASSSQRTPGTLPRKCEANPKETRNVTFSEDEGCEESMERSLQEEDSDDDMDTNEILSTEANEKRCLENPVLTGTKVSFEEAFLAVHKMMNDVLVPLQRRAVSPRDTVE
ncbi:unnamed protein product [Arabis nemorensis]|uniref:Uncharacterized protein n=1 Tax=Arabis nemorensis TaxID=586526 RepID=A0A565CQ15_9BRAS|nr:unnamed protein product [Arabis nemorensis]